jgi:hypothetical protein
MSDQPIPGSTGEIAWELPSPYLPHPATGLLHLPRFLKKCRLHLDGRLPKSYQKNFCRGFDRFLSMHLDVDPKDVLAAVESAGDNSAQLDEALLKLFPEDVKAAQWNREVVQKGMTEAGAEFLREALTAMGCASKVGEIKSVCDLIELDEGRIPGFVQRPEGT